LGMGVHHWKTRKRNGWRERGVRHQHVGRSWCESTKCCQSLIYRHLGLKMLAISRFILTSPRCYCDLAVNLGGRLWTGKITRSYANNSTFERRDTECADEEIAVCNSQHDYSLSLVSSSDCSSLSKSSRLASESLS
jgi:hypothetical protein